MIVNLKEILALAEEGSYAVPAFNVYNTETAMGVFRAEDGGEIVVSLWRHI